MSVLFDLKGNNENLHLWTLKWIQRVYVFSSRLQSNLVIVFLLELSISWPGLFSPYYKFTFINNTYNKYPICVWHCVSNFARGISFHFHSFTIRKGQLLSLLYSICSNLTRSQRNEKLNPILKPRYCRTRNLNWIQP